ncbi:hypothetical protein AMI01nite_16530 [Aneurinibacillus migulanus]|nr:hypothetical protein AMI01nite_16530 [Aneurinibacillus migulanus]
MKVERVRNKEAKEETNDGDRYALIYCKYRDEITDVKWLLVPGH